MIEYSWSFDVSTTNLGVALWNNEGVLIELKHLELKIDKNTPEEDRDIIKAEKFENYIIENKKRIEDGYNCKITNIFVEAPLQNTPKNINTTALLLGFNGMVRLSLYNVFGIIPIKISVYGSRKLFCPELIKLKKKKGKMEEVLSFPKDIDKKHYLWEKVSKLQPEINWFYTRNNTLKSTSYDMSDAYVVGVAGLIGLGIINYDEWVKFNKKFF